jgi:hypothetical protein
MIACGLTLPQVIAAISAGNANVGGRTASRSASSR